MSTIRSYISRMRAMFARLGSDPETDWRFGLAVISVALVAAIALDAYLAFDVIRDAEGEGTGTRKTVTLDRDALGEAAKKIREESQTPASIPEAALKDPSI